MFERKACLGGSADGGFSFHSSLDYGLDTIIANAPRMSGEYPNDRLSADMCQCSCACCPASVPMQFSDT